MVFAIMVEETKNLCIVDNDVMIRRLNNMTTETLITAFVELITESYRLKKTFERLVKKSDFSEQARYINQISWYNKKISEIANDVGLNIVDIEGQKFDEGMAVTTINSDEFDKDDILYIEQMIEPTIMFENKILKIGTAVLGREKQCI